jgi:GT2 family glycosyltransferase
VLSIIIPVFNQLNYTKQIVKDLSLLPIQGEVIIVDNGSTDKTKEFLSVLQPPFKSISLDSNLGFAKACNIGYKHSTYNNVCFLNNDVRLNKGDLFQSIVEAIKNHPNSILGPTGGFIDSNYCFVYETDKQKPINYISGWCLFSNKTNFEQLRIDLNNENGPFWEGNLAYFEDTYMGFQAKKLGMDLTLVSVPAKHIGKVTSKTLDISKLYTEAKQNFLLKIKDI